MKGKNHMNYADGHGIPCAAYAFFHDESYLNTGESAAECLNKLDESGFDVHVFGLITADVFSPDILLRLIADNSGGCIDSACYVVLTDIPELLKLFYELYPNIVSVFCLFDRGAPEYLPANESIYRALLDGTCDEVLSGNCDETRDEALSGNCDETRDEALSGDSRGNSVPVCSSICSSACSPVRPLFLPGFLPDDFIASVETARRRIEQGESDPQGVRSAKVYHFNGYCYIFEPFCFSLHLTGESETRRGLSLSNTRLMFPYDTTRLTNLTGFAKNIEKSPQVYESFARMADSECQRLSEYMKNQPDTVRLGILRYIELLANSGQAQIRVYYLSMLLGFERELSTVTVYINAIYRTILYTAPNEFSTDEKYTLFWQLMHFSFSHTGTGSIESARYSRLLYRTVYESWLSRFKNSMSFIPAEKRDGGLIILVTSQVITLMHGPTKTVLDRAYSLLKLGKKVLVVNTKEVLSHKVNSPFVRQIYGNTIEELEQSESYSYNNTDIPFMQLGGVMPNEFEIKRLIGMVKKLSPYFIFQVGGGSIAADLLSNMVPVIAQSLSPSSLCVTESQMQAISRKASAAEIDFLGEFGFPKEHVVEAVFTSNFKPQTSHFTRTELGLPDGKFILAVVGARLDSEVTDEFIQTLQKTAPANTHTVFMGGFERYSVISKDNPVFAECSTFLGMQPDILAALEVCDLYVNPQRVGGGTSACEAMFKGLPCVTLNYGDVAINTGPDFCCGSYSEMIEKIIEYASDREYYMHMSEKAKARVAAIMDTDSSVAALIRQVEANPAFH